MTKKTETVFVCSNCGYKSPKWLGRCPNCDMWQTFSQEEEAGQASFRSSFLDESGEVSRLAGVAIDKNFRVSSGIGELDKVLGDGFVLGASYLLGGHPGIGKSTLSLQVCISLARQNNNVMYISAEESSPQVKLRAMRLEKDLPESLFIFSSANVKNILETLQNQSPDFVVMDSVQVLFDENINSGPGSVVQIRECSYQLIRFCKRKRIPLLLIGHVTKEGFIAGPKVLEHMVDAVLYFEGEKVSHYRILRSQKNRFGATNEIAVFEMTNTGLEEVKNPSAFFLSEYQESSSGITIASVVEGTRSFLVEVQALVSKSSFSMTRRRCEGIDYNRFLLLLAMMEKRTSISLANYDVFLNIAGGLEIDDTSSDLAVCAAVFSSFKDIVIPRGICFIGEVALSGNIRSCFLMGQRVKEVARMGFGSCILPSSSRKDLQNTKNMELFFCSHLKEAFDIISKKFK